MPIKKAVCETHTAPKQMIAARYNSPLEPSTINTE